MYINISVEYAVSFVGVELSQFSAMLRDFFCAWMIEKCSFVPKPLYIKGRKKFNTFGEMYKQGVIIIIMFNR
jgi:hypothetical protein